MCFCRGRVLLGTRFVGVLCRSSRAAREGESLPAGGGRRSAATVAASISSSSSSSSRDGGSGGGGNQQLLLLVVVVVDVAPFDDLCSSFFCFFVDVFLFCRARWESVTHGLPPDVGCLGRQPSTKGGSWGSWSEHDFSVLIVKST